MNITIAGGTGFVGRSLVRRLLQEGHRVTVLSRNPGGVESRLGADVDAADVTDDGALRAAVGQADAVINFAGEGILDKRWTASRKAALRRSRVALTDRLVDAMSQAERPPAVFVSASAIGRYGPGGEDVLDECTPAGEGFTARLCQDWEAAAFRAEGLGVRVALLRIGLVLGPEGGVLGSLLPVYRAGLGGPLGAGRAWMSWIHIDDLVAIVLRALGDPSFSGPLNAVAPAAVRNRHLSRALALVTGRAARLPVPAAVLRLLLGERALLLLESARVVPARLQALGFTWSYPRLATALRACTQAPDPVHLARSNGPPSADESTTGVDCVPQLVLTHQVLLDAPLAEVFPFFARAANLGALTPAWMGFRIRGGAPESIEVGAILDYRIALGPVPMDWRTEITVWEPGRRFVDVQRRGPYRLWWHEHTFQDHHGQTHVMDRVLIRLPFGPLGVLARPLVVGTLHRIFHYRAHAMAQRFGRVAVQRKAVA